MTNNKNLQQNNPISNNQATEATSWSNINDQLSAALKTWTDISAKSAQKQAPDELQQQEVEKLLKQLQKQIAEFK